MAAEIWVFIALLLILAFSSIVAVVWLFTRHPKQDASDYKRPGYQIPEPPLPPLPPPGSLSGPRIYEEPPR